LEEAMDYCREYRFKFKEEFCEESDGCELNNRGICCEAWVHDWKLDTYRHEEIDDASKILHLFPDAMSVERHANALMVKYNDSYYANIDSNLFPSIKVGQKVMLKNILEN